MIEAGRDELTEEFRREGLPVQQIWSVDAAPGGDRPSSATSTSTRCSAAIGEHHVSARSRRPEAWPGRSATAREDASSCRRPCSRPDGQRRRNDDSVGVHVEGLDDVLVRLSRCCTPVPGDEIIGFVTRGRGVSVHRADCANAMALMSDQATRLIDVEWDGDAARRDVPGRRSRSSPSTGPGCCATSPTRCRDHHVNIVACEHRTPATTGWPRCASSSSWPTPATSTPVLRTIKQIDAVYDAYRLVPGGGRG